MSEVPERGQQRTDAMFVQNAPTIANSLDGRIVCSIFGSPGIGK